MKLAGPGSFPGQGPASATRAPRIFDRLEWRRRANRATQAGPAVEDPETIGDGSAIGLRKEDTDLKAKFNVALAAIHKDGTFDKIAKQYFDFDIYKGK